MNERYEPKAETEVSIDPIDRLEQLLVDVQEERAVDPDEYTEVCTLVSEVHGLDQGGIEKVIATIRSEIV